MHAGLTMSLTFLLALVDAFDDEHAAKQKTMTTTTWLLESIIFLSTVDKVTMSKGESARMISEAMSSDWVDYMPTHDEVC